jgi:hypothetical protein
MVDMSDEGTAQDEPAPDADEPREAPAAAEDEQEPFGQHDADRTGADVRYEGSREGHEYVVEVRHRFVDTSVSILIDGVRHDPAAEKELAKRERAEDVTTQDGLALKVDEGPFRQRITVRRPTVKGEMKDRETIHVRTTLLGGAGEVDVVRSEELIGAPLVPQEGSSSAAREARKAEHPVRYGLIAAGTQAARYVLPLLGIGALFSGLLAPVKRWIGERLQPLLAWLDEATRGIREWIGELLRPVVRLIDAVLEPVRRFIGWLWNLLFGWIPEIHLGIHLPDWIFDYLLPAMVVVVVFLVTISTIRTRRDRMDRVRRGEDPAAAEAEEQADGQAEADPEDGGARADDADGREEGAEPLPALSPSSSPN